MKDINLKNGSIVQSLIKIVSDITSRYAAILIKMAIAGDRKELDNERHRENFLSAIDLEIHSEYRERLSQVLPTFIYASEESEPQIFPTNQKRLPEFMVLVDPLDTSELAVRGLNGYTHVLVYSLKEQAPVASVVGDMFHEIRLFYAFRDQNGTDKAFLMKRNGQALPIKSSSEQILHRALVTNYLMQPLRRFQKIAEQRAFLHSLAQPDEQGLKRGRIGVDFGSIGLCHVAAGFTDAMIETAKGFALWDFFPGHYILHAAGGITASLEGNELSLDLNLQNLSDVGRAMARRQKFVAAGNSALLSAILEQLKAPDLENEAPR